MTRSPSTAGATSSTGPPHLFDLVSVVDAPSLVLSAADGQIRRGGVQGWLSTDRRLLSLLRVRVGGFEPLGLHGASRGAGVAEFRSVVPQLGGPDPTVFVDRHRQLGHHALVETLSVSSAARHEVAVELSVEAEVDFSSMASVRSGAAGTPARAEVGDGALRWTRDGDTTTLRADPRPDTVDAERGVLTWSLVLRPGHTVVVTLRAEGNVAHGSDTAGAAGLPGAAAFVGVDAAPWHAPAVTCPDWRVPRLLQQGLDDLGGLLLRDTSDHPDDSNHPAEPGRPADRDVFAAAGSPWFLTLFGRDSLWTARMLLPLGTELAMSTLRVLARRQGVRDHAETEEQPGKILHEVRPEPLVLEHLRLPPVYFGSVDATPLFVICLAEAWRWGAPPGEVEALLPATHGCLRWLEEQAGDGFLRYLDATGQGLSNQGWKDSEDSIQWADGSLATPPIALSEVQAYAFGAAMSGADLLDAFGLPEGARWRSWASELAGRFRDAFWVSDARGRYPAVALDGDGAAVDSVASNMGHLLGTGLLTAEEESRVAQRLAGTSMDSGFGLRTLTAEAPTYSRLSYHGGAVWPHDTAVAVSGLARAGFAEPAAALLQGLVRAAPHFDFRLPELYGGDAFRDTEFPTPYPAACRPQAWAAAAPLAGLVALLGLDVDVPGGRVAARPMLSESLRPMSVSGLRLGAHTLTVEVDRDGSARVETDHPGVRVG